MIARTVLLLSVGTGGALLARRIKMPGGAFLGAMLATGLFSVVLADFHPLPEGFRWVALLLLGIYTGSSVDREVLARIQGVLPVALTMIMLLIAAAVGLGWVFYTRAASDLSLVTVMLGTMPGGASGLAAVAYDMGAEAHLVASLHMVRQVMVFGVLPLVLRWLATDRPAPRG